MNAYGVPETNVQMCEQRRKSTLKHCTRPAVCKLIQMHSLKRQRAIQACPGDLVIYNCQQLTNASEYCLAIVTRIVDTPHFCGFAIRNCRTGSTSSISVHSVSHVIPWRYVPKQVFALFDFSTGDIAQSKLSDSDVHRILQHASSEAAASIQRAVKQRYYAFPDGALFRRLADKYADHAAFRPHEGDRTVRSGPVCG